MRIGRRQIVMGVVAALVVAIIAYGLPHIDLEQFLRDLADKLGKWTYLLVGAMAFAETAAFLGFIAPGEFAVILGGVIAGQGEISVYVLLGIVWFAAFAGDSIGFLVGARLGRSFATTHGHRIGLTAEHLGRVERYFRRHGGKTIVIGRFIGFVRPLAPFSAGSSGMRYRTFVPYSILGTGLWCTTFVLLGYFFAQSIDQVTKWAGRGTFAFGLLVFTVAVVVLAVRWLRVKENRARMTAFFERTPVLRLLPPVARAFWRVVGPEARFVWGRLTPGRLGLQFTTVISVLAVGVYVLVLYLVLLNDDLGPTPGDHMAMTATMDTAHAWLTSLAKAVTQLGAGYVTWPLTALVGVWLAVRRSWLELSVLIVGMAITIAGVSVIKDAVDRPRPPDPLVAVAGSSFPSGHAAYSTVYIAIAIVVARVGPFLARFALIVTALVLAAAIGLSRVYLRAHWLSDVFGGWALGAAAFALCAAVALVIAHLRQNDRPDALADAVS